MASMTEAARLKRVKRKAAHVNNRIWKVREDSPHYREFGPYSVLDLTTNALVAQRLDLDDLEQEYAESPTGT